jgi:hypothetical protein
VVFCLRQIQNFDGSNKVILGAGGPAWFPGTVVYQDYHGGHYRKENGLTYNDAMEIQTPRSRSCSLTLGRSEQQRGDNVAGRMIRRKQIRPEP